MSIAKVRLCIERYIGFAFIITVLSLAMTACESKRTIVHGLDEREANEIMVLLERNHIFAYKIQEKATGAGGPKIVLWDIAVSSVDAMQSMAILSVNGLPRKHSSNLLDLFSASGLVPSDTSEKVRYQAGLAASIASTIRKIDGVVDADVILSFPKEDPLNPAEIKVPITASVYVKHTGVLDDPNSHLISKIKQLVASSISGLSYDNVTVVPDRVRIFTPTTSFIPAAPKEYVEVWGFMIARSSLLYFQAFFFCVSVLIFIFFFAVFWLGWKLYPLLKQRGGIKQLFTFSPLRDRVEVQEVKQTSSEKPKEEKELSDKSLSPKVQENREE